MYVQKRKDVNNMNSEELRKTIEVFSKEAGMDKDYLYDAIELGLNSAYKKQNKLPNSRVEINRETGEIKMFSFKTVVLDREHKESLDEGFKDEEELTEEQLNDEELEDLPEEDRYRPFIFNDKLYITLEDARKIEPSINVGETIEEEVTPSDFGRVAAATAKQVLVQKIREAERNNIAAQFEDKEGELISGTVEMEDEKNYFIDFGKTQGLLPKSEIIPGEKIKMGSNIKAYISKVDINNKGALILLTRKYYGFITRLFELEIPEVSEGEVMIYSVARDAGNRTKIAVYSDNPNIDAVGTCVGERGTRINNILKELNGEKIDIVAYSKDPVTFITNALAPAKDLKVFILDEKTKETMVVVNDENLKLAIGRRGINVKLASRLTHYNLEIKTYEQVKEAGINILE